MVEEENRIYGDGVNIASRGEGVDLEYMKQRIEIFSYLSIHTRQIGRVVLNEFAVSRYRAKFTKDVDSVVYGLETNNYR